MHVVADSALNAKELGSPEVKSRWWSEGDVPLVPCTRVFVLSFGLVLASWLAALT